MFKFFNQPFLYNYYCKKGENISTVSYGMQGGDITHWSLNLYLCPDDTFVLSIIISFFQASLEVEWHFFLVGRSWCPIRRSKLSFMMGLIQYSLLNTLMRLRISCGVSSFEEHRHLKLQANLKQNWTKNKAILSISGRNKVFHS